MKTIIINLIGATGSGKSTAAAEVFASLKKAGRSCEMVLESFEDSDTHDPIYDFAKTHHEILRLLGKVEFIIVDRPFPIFVYHYGKKESEYFGKFVIEHYNRLNNLMYFLKRDEYLIRDTDEELIAILREYSISYKSVSHVQEILTDLARIIE